MKKSIYGLIVLLLSVHRQIFAQSADAPPKDQGLLQMIMIFVVCGLFFYLILWKPEQKRRKAMEAIRNSLNKGDKVTAMGFLGTVVRVLDQTVILKLYDGAKIEVLKAAITDVIPGSEEDAKKAERDNQSLAKKDDQA